jgi:hypothetical protein
MLRAYKGFLGILREQTGGSWSVGFSRGFGRKNRAFLMLFESGRYSVFFQRGRPDKATKEEAGQMALSA